MSAAGASSGSSNVMRILVPALIIDMLAFTCILPLFPSILNFYAKSGHRDQLYDLSVSLLKSFQSALGVPHNERYNNVFFGGLLGSMFSALQFLASPTLGALSDIYGRRTMLLLSCIGTLISYIVWLRAETFTVFVLSRIIGGLSKANVNVATAIVTDVYKSEDNPKGMALIGISYSVGFLIGPMFGAYFSTIAPKDALHTTPAIFSIVLTCIHFLLVAFLLPETLKYEERRKSEDIVRKANQLVSPLDLFRFSAVDAPTESSMQQSKIYLFTGLLMLPIQGRIVRKTPMIKQKRVAEIGIMCIVPAFMVVAQATNQYMLYFGLFLYAIASATVVSCLTSLVSAVHPSTDKGALAGVFRSIGALARALGPVIASTCKYILKEYIWYDWFYFDDSVLLSSPDE
ncbi:transporter, major facilitator family protein [Ancylostoma ceylanicum]|uniref:Transporter, major facilitator family protein n=1 Tax=Ancylostoma ceylanicum TaxID=53326 RepID=A0A0D6M379_9BILA|nr:transporter, major facilitator family protein [Ancylostoma ceylanicum]